ncbi:Spindle and kinetochore-associated protein 3 [Frankliniella fusca]|uniref:Spindle and kinetochore-associated protein 3 n=1 Tax=Frankliniella fusca TaxID=407009 RepID=A0AAE1H1S5_9NEOP|nr:Spindle and kinetochore-associated protein 3 [Frankliniella fusca]
MYNNPPSGARRAEDAAALQRAVGAVGPIEVRCNDDPDDPSLELLQHAAPTLERLSVIHPRVPHLRAVHAMPRLRRLSLWCGRGPLCADGVFGTEVAEPEEPELGALPPEHAGLRWLCVLPLPRATLESLLRAHGGTLEDLELVVGANWNEPWPRGCDDLHLLLGRCGLRALRSLVLFRWIYSHAAVACRMQLAAVRAALPGSQVLCRECDEAEMQEP